MPPRRVRTSKGRMLAPLAPSGIISRTSSCSHRQRGSAPSNSVKSKKSQAKSPATSPGVGVSVSARRVSEIELPSELKMALTRLGGSSVVG
eukprot:scaffold262_cov230-Pinguiococcus_pyrenoidosus.AAC.3